MAEVTLMGRTGVDRLPAVCMYCGGRADVRKRKKFSWAPVWVYGFAPLGGLPFALLLVLLRKEKVVEVPLCRRHSVHWILAAFKAVGGLFTLFGLAVTAIVLAAGATQRLGQGNAVTVGMLLGLLALFVVGLPGLVVYVRKTTIRPTRITDDRITLTNVATAFAERAEGDMPFPARRW